jgi:hypothetical protein
MSNLFICHSSDAGNTEGIGAMVQYQIYTYALSKILNIGFAFKPFTRMQHYQYFDITQEKFCSDINNFFNFPNDLSEEAKVIDVKLDDNLINLISNFRTSNNKILFNIKDEYFMKKAEQYLDYIENSNILNNIIKNIKIEDNLKYFNNEFFNICLHIRKATITDCDFSPIRELFDHQSKDKIINILQQSINKFANNEQYKIHIYSQGKIDDFDFILKNFKNNVIFHIDEYPIVSLYHMINSDLLIMSNSSFSYIAHLLSKNITIVRNNFYHRTYNKNKYFYDSRGNII